MDGGRGRGCLYGAADPGIFQHRPDSEVICIRILHIAAHMGGGAGKAIAGIALLGARQFGEEHRILLLEKPEKDGFVEMCRADGVSVSMWSGDVQALTWADVIVVSWWNHPAMARFLREFPRCGVRLALWCHVNGCHYPHLPFSLARAFDKVLFTSPYSLRNPHWTAEEQREIEGRSEIVYGMGDFRPQEIAPRMPAGGRETFCIGYVGTLNYGKLHPDFVTFCKAVCDHVPEARFVMVGDRNGGLEQDIRSAGLWERFSFPGYITDVPAMLRTFDVFGYLLNPEHYGTTENVLLEAMACAVPPVVLRQNVEQYIVPPGEELTVRSPEEYGQRIADLYRRPDAAERLGRRAREHVLRQYGAKENAERFRKACLQVSGEEKRQRDFSFLGDTPWQWFLSGLDRRQRDRFQDAAAGPGDAAELLRNCPPIFREERKSSLRHFAAIYPEDEVLSRLCKLMEEQHYGRDQAKL